MLLLDAGFREVRHVREFGRVEAVIDLTVKPGAGQPVQRISIRTSQPRTGALPLRHRLVADALMLARALRATPRRPSRRPMRHAA